MIRHICMFKLKDENKEANLKEALRRLEEMREISLIATFEVEECGCCSGQQL